MQDYWCSAHGEEVRELQLVREGQDSRAGSVRRMIDKWIITCKHCGCVLHSLEDAVKHKIEEHPEEIEQ